MPDNAQTPLSKNGSTEEVVQSAEDKTAGRMSDDQETPKTDKTALGDEEAQEDVEAGNPTEQKAGVAAPTAHKKKRGILIGVIVAVVVVLILIVTLGIPAMRYDQASALLAPEDFSH